MNVTILTTTSQLFGTAMFTTGYAYAPFTAVFFLETKRDRSMQAYHLNATIDESGHLIIDEPLNIAPGKVEVIILQPDSILGNFY
ncbi:hypothetical protein [Komarekiella delphini-convector]|uniref:hypothetical protein n=1 Tax=Komarekiella delphini-convector TaxID=3050158 RepID=UPI001CD844BE|nr:hypothetical protein [Komarekiella delphini-convector]